MMRVELVNGRHLLRGVTLSKNHISSDQIWALADGGKSTVTVIQRDAGWITYQGTDQPAHTRNSESFQAQYNLVLPTAEIPNGLRA
jgi:hypothetical protein